jgi:hypothetical protein
VGFNVVIFFDIRAPYVALLCWNQLLLFNA